MHHVLGLFIEKKRPVPVCFILKGMNFFSRNIAYAYIKLNYVVIPAHCTPNVECNRCF